MSPLGEPVDSQQHKMATNRQWELFGTKCRTDPPQSLNLNGSFKSDLSRSSTQWSWRKVWFILWKPWMSVYRSKVNVSPSSRNTTTCFIVNRWRRTLSCWSCYRTQDQCFSDLQHLNYRKHFLLNLKHTQGKTFIRKRAQKMKTVFKMSKIIPQLLWWILCSSGVTNSKQGFWVFLHDCGQK